MSDSNNKNDLTPSEETGFNESELQDIMNEIESLEKEFGSDAPVATQVDLAQTEDSLKIEPVKVIKTDLQKQIDDELLEADQILDEMDMSVTSKEEVVAEVEDFSNDELADVVHTEMLVSDELESLENDNVISLASAPVTSSKTSMASTTAKSGSPVSLACEGTMNLSMSFKLGEGEVKLYVDGDRAVSLTFAGVEVQMTEAGGCVVEMNNGVKFQIPLVSTNTKKNVA